MKSNKTGFAMILGIGVGLAVILLVCILGGVGISGGKIPETMTTGIGWAAAALGSAVASLIIGLRTKEKKLLWTLCGGAVLFLMLLLTHSLAFHGQTYVLTGSVAAVFLPACVVGIFLVQRRTKRKYWT